MTRTPNILFILVDDMGYGDFSRLNPHMKDCPATPRLDALMDEGMTFTQHYTASPVCNPSRAALLTGRYPHRTGSVDTLEWRGVSQLSLRETTLADRLRQAGYATGHIGKWHLGNFDKKYHPCSRGFDEAVCFQGGMHDYYQWRIEFGMDNARRSDGRYMTDVWTDEAVSFIDRHAGDDKPFFLHLNYNAPHTPLQCPEEDVRPFAETGLFNEAVSTLYGMLRRMDRGIERVLAELDRHGLADDTIVVFSSDNGPQFGYNGFYTGVQGDITRFNCSWAGSKCSVYEGGIRVPGIVRWPDGGVPAKATNDQMVHFVDWMPTLLAAAGVELHSDLPIDGVNVLPALRGDTADVCTTRCWQWNRYDPVPRCNAAIRDGDWKLIFPRVDEAMAINEPWLLVSMYGAEHFEHYGIMEERCPPRDIPDERPTPQLYNLADDPGEQNDLYATNREQAGRLEKKLDTWFEDVSRDYHDAVAYGG